MEIEPFYKVNVTIAMIVKFLRENYMLKGSCENCNISKRLMSNKIKILNDIIYICHKKYRNGLSAAQITCSWYIVRFAKKIKI